MLKPEPQIYERAAEGLAVPPHECVFVDDQPECLLGARAVGMTTARIDRPNREDRHPEDGGYDLRMENLGELLDWLPPRAAI